MNDVSALYICDRKACGNKCPNQKCTHTLDPFHAIHFKPVTDDNGLIIAYEEKMEEKND